jgi:hypothetical protein
MGVVLAVLVAAAGVVEVREVEAVDALVLDELQQPRQVVGVVLRHREAHADLQAEVAAEADAAQRGSKAPCMRRNLSCVARMPSRLTPT